MKIFLRVTAALLFAIFVFYLNLPSFDFPKPPPDSIQSNEPADTETPLRRAYFTNYSRAEVLSYYQNQLRKSSFLNLPLPTYRLNYPPEEARTLIRDQTRSTYLEEIVHPFRESIFVNGFEPKGPQNRIFIEGRVWSQKIIIRYIPSNIWLRISLGIISLILTGVVFIEWKETFKELKQIRN